jgi:hypothetical protein
MAPDDALAAERTVCSRIGLQASSLSLRGELRWVTLGCATKYGTQSIARTNPDHAFGASFAAQPGVGR